MISILLGWSLVASSATAAQETTVAEEPAEVTEKTLSVEEILARDPEQSDYTEEPRCLQTQRIRKMEVIDEKHVSMQVSRDKYYLVQFEHRCPGLRRGRPVMYEPSAGNRLCQLDRIRGVYDNGIGGFTPGIPCAINGFKSVTKEQLVMLKDALKVERRKKKDA